MDKYDVLRKYFGYSSFRKGQEEMVDCLLSGRDALRPPKSLCKSE